MNHEDTCRHFWSVHVPELLERYGADTGLASLNARALFEIRDCGTWSIRVAGGVIEHVGVGADHDASVTVRIDPRTFVEIATGALGHKEAFFRGRVRLSGDIPLALWIANLIPVLRERFPYHPPERSDCIPCER